MWGERKNELDSETTEDTHVCEIQLCSNQPGATSVESLFFYHPQTDV